MKTTLTLILFCSMVVLSSCSKEDDNLQAIPPATSGTMERNSADNEALKLIVRNCNNSGCHGPILRMSSMETMDGVNRMINDGSFQRRLFVSNSTTPCGSIDQSSMEKLKVWFDGRGAVE